MFSTCSASLDAYDSVGYGELASLGAERLARIRTGVLVACVRDGENTETGRVRDHVAARLRAHVAPVQAPVDERHRESSRLTFETKRGAQAHRQLAHWWFDHFGLDFFKIKKKIKFCVKK